MLLSHFLQPSSVSLWRSQWAQAACRKGNANLQRTPATTKGEISLTKTEESLSVTTLNFVSGSCLDFFHWSVGGVSIIVTVQRFTLWRYSVQGNHALLQTGELPLQLTHQFCLPCLPKFTHHLACSEWHVMVKKLTTLDFLSWNPLYSLTLVELNYI